MQVEGLANFRDLGGRRRASGPATPRGVFFRAANVDGVTAAGWRTIRRAGIRTVVDLRRPDERVADLGTRHSWLTVRHVDLDGWDAETFWREYWDNGLVATPLYYPPHLAAMPRRTVQALSAIVSAPPGGVLFHCMGGRDRTGEIAMLLHTVAGVVADEIVEDYLGDGSLPEPVRRVYEKHGTDPERALRQVLAGLDVAALLEAGAMPAADRRALYSWRGTLA